MRFLLTSSCTGTFVRQSVVSALPHPPSFIATNLARWDVFCWVHPSANSPTGDFLAIKLPSCQSPHSWWIFSVWNWIYTSHLLKFFVRLNTVRCVMQQAEAFMLSMWGIANKLKWHATFYHDRMFIYFFSGSRRCQWMILLKILKLHCSNILSLRKMALSHL